jgi:hypothetical protein
MGSCVKCGKKGLFLKVNSEGLCGDCFRKTQGLLGAYDLYDWWNQEFTAGERLEIENVFKPFTASSSGGAGSVGGMLTSGDYTWKESKFGFLSILLGWFHKKEHYQIAQKIIKLADAKIGEAKDTLEKHYYFLHKIKAYYPNRDNYPEALDLAIKACEDQIAISKETKESFLKDPSFKVHNDSGKIEHTGFKQLCIIREKQGKWEEVIRLSQMAKEQDFWEGDWDKRIEKAKKKLGAI